MVNKRKIILALTYLTVSVFIILGIITAVGGFTEPEVHLFVHEFEFEGVITQLALRFESESGVFVTGKEINVKAFLLFPYDSSSLVFHLLYFPDALEPDEYRELIPKENFGKPILNETDGTISFKSPQGKILHNLNLFPPVAEFDVIWTQDGPKDAVLLMDAKTISMSKEGLIKSGAKIEKIITIQPSDVKQQTQSNNVSLGLASVIIGITILTAFFGVEKIWFLPKFESN